MGTLYRGDTIPDAIYRGATLLDAVYRGAEKVWPYEAPVGPQWSLVGSWQWEGSGNVNTLAGNGQDAATNGTDILGFGYTASGSIPVGEKLGAGDFPIGVYDYGGVQFESVSLPQNNTAYGEGYARYNAGTLTDNAQAVSDMLANLTVGQTYELRRKSLVYDLLQRLFDDGPNVLWPLDGSLADISGNGRDLIEFDTGRVAWVDDVPMLDGQRQAMTTTNRVAASAPLIASEWPSSLLPDFTMVFVWYSRDPSVRGSPYPMNIEADSGTTAVIRGRLNYGTANGTFAPIVYTVSGQQSVTAAQNLYPEGGGPFQPNIFHIRSKEISPGVILYEAFCNGVLGPTQYQSDEVRPERFPASFWIGGNKQTGEAALDYGAMGPTAVYPRALSEAEIVAQANAAGLFYSPYVAAAIDLGATFIQHPDWYSGDIVGGAATVVPSPVRDTDTVDGLTLACPEVDDVTIPYAPFTLDSDPAGDCSTCVQVVGWLGSANNSNEACVYTNGKDGLGANVGNTREGGASFGSSNVRLYQGDGHHGGSGNDATVAPATGTRQWGLIVTYRYPNGPAPYPVTDGTIVGSGYASSAVGWAHSSKLAALLDYPNDYTRTDGIVTIDGRTDTMRVVGGILLFPRRLNQTEMDQLLDALPTIRDQA